MNWRAGAYLLAVLFAGGVVTWGGRACAAPPPGSLSSADREGRAARLDLARQHLRQGRLEPALGIYDELLKANPRDPDALLGKARVTFYQGKFQQAHAVASQALAARPDDFSSAFLLASIAHARGRRSEALEFLDRAERLSPRDPDVAALREQILSESRVLLRTTAAYAREIGPPNEFGLANEDLRLYTYGTTLEFGGIPRTTSFVSFAALPANSPPGPERDSYGNQLPTGITGAAAPYEFLYRQSTRLGKRWTLRGGAGFAHFGPGIAVAIPTQEQPIISARERPTAVAGASFRATQKLSFDADATKLPITYTPLSTRLGVVEDRLLGRLNYFFTPRTELHVAYWYSHYSSEDYEHPVAGAARTAVYADYDQEIGGSVALNRKFFQAERFSFDAGYEGTIYGFAGREHKIFMGFFNPSYYQLHELVPRFYGTLWGPLGYDLRAGIGVQQVDNGAVTRAWNIAPELSLRVHRHLRLVLGYRHYNTAQILGPLRGNEVHFTTEWQY